MFKYLITIYPLGMMYGSSGGFLSPENLVGRSRSKFPPDAATLSGLFFSANKVYEKNKSPEYKSHEELREKLYLAGPFWSKTGVGEDIFNFHLPIPWHKVISKTEVNEWQVIENKWQLKNQNKRDIEPDYQWQTIGSWNKKTEIIQAQSAATSPWQYVPVLHPKLKEQERHVQDRDGLFLENAVQIPDDICLTYLSTYSLPDGWYRFGGENHVVEIKTEPISENEPFLKLFQQPIERTFALITPAVWGSNQLSLRYPQHPNFPEPELMLTDKPVPYRCRLGGRMGRGRYAVPAGSVYVLKEPLNQSWWEWENDWFPKEGFSLKKVGCGLCLPVEIEGIN
ncbi:MAG: hypothetical protein QNJ55_22950 [Xenococcus sp. MO_188.B8]|nr:hypothetical protein [Xenococcus sp. MO_188.B8]